MAETPTADVDLDAEWGALCRKARSHAELMSHRCRARARRLLHADAERYCDRDPPASPEELERRQQELSYLASRVGQISHAELMAQDHPLVADRILHEAALFSRGLDLDDDPFESSLALISKISELCGEDR